MHELRTDMMNKKLPVFKTCINFLCTYSVSSRTIFYHHPLPRVKKFALLNFSVKYCVTLKSHEIPSQGECFKKNSNLGGKLDQNLLIGLKKGGGRFGIVSSLKGVLPIFFVFV